VLTFKHGQKWRDMGKSNGRHSLLLATGVRIIRAPDREAELLGHSLLQLQNAPRPRYVRNHCAG
jgi:hypothetical protein